MGAETDRQRAILQYLEYKRGLYWRNNTVGVWDAKKGVYRQNHAVLNGVPDILGIRPGGGFVGIEVKSAKGVSSPEQIAFREKALSLDAICIVARSVDEAMDQLEGVLL